MKPFKINEEHARIFTTKQEERWKKRLSGLLRDDGLGHHHAYFADRLKDFNLYVVDASKEPSFTAAISFEKNVIYVSSGFLDENNRAIFRQLSVLMRHELAHNLMRHQVRMLKKYKSKNYDDELTEQISASVSLHDLNNVLEDFEISNKRYTDDDKKTVINMTLNGRVIGGLITELHRESWKEMSLESMYDELEKEIDTINAKILAEWDTTSNHTTEFTSTDAFGRQKLDRIKYEINKVIKDYKNVDAPANFILTSESDSENILDDYINGKSQILYHLAVLDDESLGPCVVRFSNLSPKRGWQKIMQIINDNICNSAATKSSVNEIILKIAKASPVEPVDIIDPNTGKKLLTVISPEEKLIAVDSLKVAQETLEQYDKWYKKAIELLNGPEFTEEDRKKVLDNL